MSGGRWLVASGVVAVALGVATIVFPGLAGVVGAGDLAVTLVGALALAAGLHLARGRVDYPPVVTDPPPVVEGESHAPTPGEVFDAALDGSAERHQGGERSRRAVRAELRTVAVEVAAWRRNCSREAAEAHVAAGSWTDDPVAATFLTAATPGPPSALDRVRYRLGRETAFQRRARRTADALVALADGEPEGGHDG